MREKFDPGSVQTPLSPSATACVVIGAASVFAAIVVAAIWSGKSILIYIEEPAGIFEFPATAGLASYLGIFALSSASVICLFASFHVRQDRALLFWSGLFGLMIAGDDFFMVHDGILPVKLGIPEILVLGAYGIFALGIFLSYRASLWGRQHIGLYVGVCFLAASVIIDLPPANTVQLEVVEDSLKFIGLLVWSAYWIGRAHLASAPVAQKQPG